MKILLQSSLVPNTQDFFRRYSLHLTYCILSLLSVWIFLIFTLTRDYAREVEGINRTNDQLTAGLEEHVRRSLYTMDAQLQLIKGAFEQEGFSPGLARFTERSMRNPLVLEVMILDAKGNLLTRVQQGPQDINLAFRSYFQAHVNADTGKMFISEPIAGPYSQKMLLCLSRRLNFPDGSFAGIVSVAMDAAYFSEFYQRMGLLPGQLVRIVGLDGIVRASWSARMDELSQNIQGGALFDALQHRRDGNYQAVGIYYDVDRFMSYRSMPDFPMIVQVGYEAESALEEYKERRALYIGAAIVVSALILLFTAVAMLLAKSRMQAENSLREMNESLENLVIEKTQALFAANEELTALNSDMNHINQLLGETNQQLEEEISIRQEKEAELLLRSQQYQAATRLLIEPVEQSDHLMRTILRDTLQLVKAPEGYIGLLNEADDRFIIQYAIGIRTEDIGKPLPITAGLRGQVFATGEPQWVEDYRIYPLRSPKPSFEGLTTFLAFPLRNEQRVIGILAAYWFDKPQPPTQDALDIMRQYSDLASVALKNAMLHERTLHLALHDPLTGLPNRAGLSNYLESEMMRMQKGQSTGAVLFIDLDDLKVINDNYGHSFGDSVIRTAGGHIQETVGPSSLVARIGGDEFVVVLSGMHSRDEISATAEKLVSLLNQDYEVFGEHLRLTASLGIALYPEDGENAEDLLKKADMAMYAAKTAGKDCWCFFEQRIGEESYERMVLTNSLRRALERDELSLAFQPQLACDGSRIVGFEALVRWNSQDHGLVSPSRFIPLAEQSGLILPIGQHVLIQACRFAKRLKDAGHPELRVSVNISPKQLAKPEFVAMVRKIIQDAGIDANQLEAEITENVLIESMEESIRKLSALKKLGIGMALDDFGSGYSSLTYLRRLPVDTLKIDKAFIDPILENESQERFVRFIIEMAHSLNLQVVAEGVEESAQKIKLERLGCDIIQGYVFSRPLPDEKALALIR